MNAVAGSAAEDRRDAGGPPRYRSNQEQVARGTHAVVPAAATNVLTANVAEGAAIDASPACQGRNSIAHGLQLQNSKTKKVFSGRVVNRIKFGLRL